MHWVHIGYKYYIIHAIFIKYITKDIVNVQYIFRNFGTHMCFYTFHMSKHVF